jgi:hypothetical protein
MPPDQKSKQSRVTNLGLSAKMWSPVKGSIHSGRLLTCLFADEKKPVFFHQQERNRFDPFNDTFDQGPNL